MKKNALYLFILVSGLITISQAQVNVMHTFIGGATDGSYPQYTNLIQDGSTLYGMTSNGGSSNLGTIFKIETDGSGFALLHSFTGGAADGSYPLGSLIKDGSDLYGMTYNGGSSNLGTIFEIETNGSGFGLLHTFTGGAADGSYPLGSLIQDGSTLYGMTTRGGSSNSGTIFEIETNGTYFALLHSFTGGVADGSYPYGSLIQDGSTLYGMTYSGGSSNSGTIFKIETAGSSFGLLHTFTGGAADGSYPYGSLIQDGSTLYGMTYSGGSSGSGTIFEIETNGTYFALLHSFTGGVADGSYPYGSLIQDGSTLYGMTIQGSSSGIGTIFEIETAGSGFALLHTFTGGAADGSYPFGSLIQDGSTLYGMTYFGGSSGIGTIFSFSLSPVVYPYVIISGYVKYANNNPIDGVLLEFSNSGLTATTDANGYYERFITKGWHGTATPSLAGLFFTPSSITYSGIQTNMPNQNYIGEKDHITISGFVRDGNNDPIEGVEVAFNNGGATVFTSASGYYTSSFTNGWGGTSTATKDGWTFTPSGYTYTPVTSNLINQNYSGTDMSLAVNDLFGSMPIDFTVLPAYPNPFNPSTTIAYGLDRDSNVSIAIYDVSGKLITTLLNTEQTQGWHSIQWNGTNTQGKQVPAGLYLSRITSNNEVKTTKLMLLK